jgi:colanic acid biosynthesis glycosyl transferase WcaI
MSKPSVLFLNRVYPPGRGATGRILRDLARSFAREGWDVTVVTTGKKKSRMRDGGVEVVRVKSSNKPLSVLGYVWVWIKMMIVALRQPNTNLVVTMSDPPLLIIAGHILKWFKGGRHIHWCHDLYPDILPALDVRVPAFAMEFVKKRTRRAMQSADKVIVIGRCMARHLAYNGIDPKHITMIPNWPDFELVRAQGKNGFNGAALKPANQITPPEGAKPYEEQLNIGSKFRVLYAGNIGRAHPIDTILEAAEILNHEHPEIEFVFVGDGPRFEEIAQARAARHLDNIRLMPYQPSNRLRHVMESGDLHLISVKEEAAGMLVPCKLYSALAVQRPCIFLGPSQSEAAKVINDFKAGIVIPQGDARALAESIKKFRLNGDDWHAAHDGAANASQIFVPKDAIDAWIERAWGVVKQDMRMAA